MSVAAAGAAAALDVPSRSAGGQTLAVPEAHLDLGQIFYLSPGRDSQVSLTSRAPLQRIVAVSSRAVGYVAAPFDFDAAERPVLAGAFRLPVASLRTGSGAVESWLRGPDLLDAAGHPEVVVEITGCQNVRALAGGKDDGSGPFVYELELLGRLGALNASLPLGVPARVSFHFGTGRTFARMRGDVMTLESRFEVDLAPLGWQLPNPSLVDLLATTIEVDLFLFFSTVSPDKTFDPRYTKEQYEAELRFTTLLRDLDDPAAAFAFGRAHARERIWDDGRKLLRLVEIVLDDPEVRHRDLRFALDLALRAAELAGGTDQDVLVMVKRIRSAMGGRETSDPEPR